MKHYVIVTDFGDIFKFSGELPPEVLEAGCEGDWDVIDVTDPTNPLTCEGEQLKPLVS